MNGIEEREVAEIAKFTPVELKEYEDSLKTYRNLKNSLDTAEEKGETKGEAKERVIGTGTTDSRQITNQRTCPYDSVTTFLLGLKGEYRCAPRGTRADITDS